MADQQICPAPMTKIPIPDVEFQNLVINTLNTHAASINAVLKQLGEMRPAAKAAPASAPEPAPAPRAPRTLAEQFGHTTYAQAGEDRVLCYLFAALGMDLSKLRYADIGAACPGAHNNTYLFYMHGASGLLVEADPGYLSAYRSERPRDAVAQVAIVPSRLRNQGTITFYAMETPGWSTVCADHAAAADKIGWGGVREVMTVPCRTLDEVLEPHFGDGQLDLLSLDVEDIDIEVLAEFDLERFRPKAMILEQVGAARTRIMEAGYDQVASTYVNSIFVRRDCMEKFRL